MMGSAAVNMFGRFIVNLDTRRGLLLDEAK